LKAKAPKRHGHEKGLIRKSMLDKLEFEYGRTMVNLMKTEERMSREVAGLGLQRE
jgi:hypothetical protein